MLIISKSLIQSLKVQKHREKYNNIDVETRSLCHKTINNLRKKLDIQGAFAKNKSTLMQCSIFFNPV